MKLQKEKFGKENKAIKHFKKKKENFIKQN